MDRLVMSETQLNNFTVAAFSTNETPNQLVEELERLALAAFPTLAAADKDLSRSLLLQQPGDIHEAIERADRYMRLNETDRHAECEEAFTNLRAARVSAPLLALPNVSHDAPPFILDTDASGFAIGAVLSQTDSQGVKHPTVSVLVLFLQLLCDVGLVIAGLADLTRPVEKNWNLFSVNLFVGATGIYQLCRIFSCRCRDRGASKLLSPASEGVDQEKAMLFAGFQMEDSAIIEAGDPKGTQDSPSGSMGCLDAGFGVTKDNQLVRLWHIRRESV
ncbi:hypothetical protein SprV_0602208800 [Sparganum proliferum]